MKRTLYATAFAVSLTIIGLWLFPYQKESIALAGVARAMSSVKSAHLVGWQYDYNSGERRNLEVWVNGPSRCRIRLEGGEDIADNGEKLVDIDTTNGVCTAMIKHPREFPGLKPGVTYLDLFWGAEALKAAMQEANSATAARPATINLPNGRRAVVTEIHLGAGSKTVITIDADSRLLVQWETYGSDGKLMQKIERLEYNMEIPDSIFDLDIPDDAVVSDLRMPEPPDIVARRQAMAERLRASGGQHAAKFDTGDGGCSYHPGIRFRCLGRNGIEVFYFPKSDTYFVLGKALVYDHNGGTGFRQVVEDAEFKLPDEVESR